MTAAAYWWVNTVTVETFRPATANSPSKFATAVAISCWVEDGNKLVLDGDGSEVVSSTAIHGPLDQADRFIVGSQVTVNGRPSRVLSLERYDSGALGLDLEHFVARIT